MFFLISYLIFINILSTWGSNAGSAIFYNRFARADCWNEKDIAKLRARKLFEQLVPSPVSPERINSRYIRDTLRFFHEALNSVEKYDDQGTSMILKEALADTIGAHLRSEVLPTARFSYYAGYVPYKRVRELHDFYDNIKKTLNTQGLGWKAPESIPEWSNLTVAKILIGNGKYFNPCGCLVMKRDTSSCIHLPSPKLDDDSEPSAIDLPLKTDGLVSLTAPVSENILLKYYTTASRCILNSSPIVCRHGDFVNFNNEMWHWMKRNVAPHLGDEKLYAAYGGVLRIAAAVQSYGKGLTRRNLLESLNNRTSKWRPWQAVTGTYFYVDTDWTPYIYVGIVLLAALSICLMQICFYFVSSDEEGRSCWDRPKQTSTKDVSYANVESNIPVMLPTQTMSYQEQQSTKCSNTKIKNRSVGSIRTQKVFDMMENSEKLMTVLSEEGSSSSTGSRTSRGERKIISSAMQTTSPPKIATDISQVQIAKGTKDGSKKAAPLQLLSTTTITGSDASDGSESSGSSASSATSKSRGEQSRGPRRDLDWARRVASERTLQTTPTTTLHESDSRAFYFYN